MTTKQQLVFSDQLILAKITAQEIMVNRLIAMLELLPDVMTGPDRRFRRSLATEAIDYLEIVAMSNPGSYASERFLGLAACVILDYSFQTEHSSEAEIEVVRQIINGIKTTINIPHVSGVE